MIVESNHGIAIAMLSDWQSIKTKTNRSLYAPFSPRLEQITSMTK